MTKLDEMAPHTKLRLIDLVKAAGVDVGEWETSKRGKEGAAMNPKYCYSWSFVQPGKVVVLNIWHHAMVEDNGTVTHDFNMREFAAKRPEPEKTRALKMDAAIQIAVNEKLPVRVIVLAGQRRSDTAGAEGASLEGSRAITRSRTLGCHAL